MAANANGITVPPGWANTAPMPRLLSGAQAVQAARAIKQQRDISDAWPFNWVYPPQDSANVFQEGVLAAPAPSATYTEVLAYNVPDSCDFCMTDIMLVLNGVTYVPGDFVWKVTVNDPSGTSAQALAFRNFGQVQANLGDLVRPWKVQLGERDKIGPKSIVRASVKNVNIAQSDTAVFVARFVGYTIPQGGSRA